MAIFKMIVTVFTSDRLSGFRIKVDNAQIGGYRTIPGTNRTPGQFPTLIILLSDTQKMKGHLKYLISSWFDQHCFNLLFSKRENHKLFLKHHKIPIKIKSKSRNVKISNAKDHGLQNLYRMVENSVRRASEDQK